MNNKEKDFIKIMRFAADNDMNLELFWDEDLNVFINCNDIFFWACSDAEPLLAKDLPVLEQCFVDAPYDACLLFCARMRKIRPQGAAYKLFNKETWPLFNACGPSREVDYMNPMKPSDTFK